MLNTILLEVRGVHTSHNNDWSNISNTVLLQVRGGNSVLFLEGSRWNEIPELGVP